jgi:hypothetical protein
MHYEINVSHNGKHFFATAERSLTTLDEAKRAYVKLKAAFPEEEGFKLTVTKWQIIGESVDLENAVK